MKIIYQSNDGNLFDFEEDCLSYEKVNQLRDYIQRHITATYNADLDCSIIEVKDVEEFIHRHITKLQGLI